MCRYILYVFLYTYHTLLYSITHISSHLCWIMCFSSKNRLFKKAFSVLPKLFHDDDDDENNENVDDNDDDDDVDDNLQKFSF